MSDEPNREELEVSLRGIRHELSELYHSRDRQNAQGDVSEETEREIEELEAMEQRTSKRLFHLRLKEAREENT